MYHGVNKEICSVRLRELVSYLVISGFNTPPSGKYRYLRAYTNRSDIAPCGFVCARKNAVSDKWNSN